MLWVGVVLGLVGLVRDGAGEATPWPAAVAAWVLVPLLVLVLPVTGWFLVTYRLDLDGAGGRVRRSPGGVDIGVDELEALVVLEPSVVGRAQRGWRLQLRHPVRGVVAQVEESDRGWARALGVARRWARERPELVRDEVTRRVLAPTPID
ncbi:hypothetical protein G7075_03055 [Phycicoccus sp. HDW14]|uniref:hypothetical protein n=1 Tax=Phycicoccus sp. HDW14 TaxID=2714941 RepID=UPI00140E04C8|nr:hypothetical protein [Phycicoccus sp. HDW14]QIM20360.1 hypothetical protein G7075_03055 [Phycicoccus sp. HDW14]